MATADVTVHGAGIFGLSCAYTLLRRGARVQVIDPNGVAAGASGGIVGALAPHTPENWNDKKQFQLESLILAETFWADVAAVAGKSPGYGRLGRIQPVLDDRALDLARARSEGADRYWKGHAVWQVVESRGLGDWAPFSPTGYLIRDTLSARLHPRQACLALAAAIQSLGGEILSEAAPSGLQLWATGTAGLDALSEDLRAPVGTGVKGQAALLALDRRDAPQLFADGIHIIPHADGTTAIGSTSERDYTAPDTTDDQVDALVERARILCPAIRQAPVIGRWAGLRPRARSRAPMLGPWPGRPGHFIANGGFKIGFGMAPKIAEVMADLILESRDTIPQSFRVEASLPAQTSKA
ncbi:MAG: FAD-dependent oxidoreductase [Pseudomonadota bacterium]